MFIVFCRRKHQNKCCYICSRGKIKSTIADTPSKHLFIKSNLAFIPFLNRHPTNSLFYPLIQTQLSKSIFLAGCFLCRITRSHHLIHSDGLIQTWICFFPHFRIRPIFRFICTINNRIESRIMLSALQNVLCLLMNFIAD